MSFGKVFNHGLRIGLPFGRDYPEGTELMQVIEEGLPQTPGILLVDLACAGHVAQTQIGQREVGLDKQFGTVMRQTLLRQFHGLLELAFE